MSISLSVVVMAHPQRAHMVEELRERIDLDDVLVIWDERNNEWDTASRAWSAVDRSATHGVVIQDDAVLPREFVAGLTDALRWVPKRVPLGLYVGTSRPQGAQIARLVQNANAQHASWLRMDSLYWGVGVAVPTEHIDAMISWGSDHPEIREYDRRLSVWFQQAHLPIYYPWPSFVDHRDEGSLLGNKRSGRHAHRFIGADVSAQHIDWSGTVLDFGELNRPASYASNTRGPRQTSVSGIQTGYRPARHLRVPRHSGLGYDTPPARPEG